MLKRLATLLLGIGLIGLGVLFFLAPEQTLVVRLLMQFWPVFLILAGVVRVAGHLIDHHPRSPVGGMMLTAVGGILLAANLRGEHSFIQLLGQYWFWLLLAYVIGRVLRQYTHRLADGPRPRAFSPGAVLLMILLVGSGLVANFLTRNTQYLNRWSVPSRLASVNDYIFGDQITIEDLTPQSFALAPNTRLLISQLNGNVEITSAPQTQASARLLKHIRADNEEEARQIAQHIQLQIASSNNDHQFSVNAAGVEKRFNTTLIITLPQNLPVGIEAADIAGQVKLNNLRGAHTIRNSERVEISNNLGPVTIDGSRGAVEIEDVRGAVEIAATHKVMVREFHGPLNVRTQQGDIVIATDEKLSGDVVVISERGRIRASLPEDASFKLQAETERGRVRVRGFDEIEVPRRQRQVVVDHNVNGAAPRLVLRTTRGNIELRSVGLALVSADDDEDEQIERAAEAPGRRR